MAAEPIRFFNRHTRELEVEKVYGEGWLRFAYENPAGRFFVHIDGRTSPLSAWPSGAYYPNIGKAWTAIGGRDDNKAAGEGVIFLPLIPAGTLQPVSPTQPTEVHLSPAEIAHNPDLAEVKLMVPANSLKLSHEPEE